MPTRIYTVTVSTATTAQLESIRNGDQQAHVDAGKTAKGQDNNYHITYSLPVPPVQRIRVQDLGRTSFDVVKLQDRTRHQSAILSSGGATKDVQTPSILLLSDGYQTHYLLALKTLYLRTSCIKAPSLGSVSNVSTPSTRSLHRSKNPHPPMLN